MKLFKYIAAVVSPKFSMGGGAPANTTSTQKFDKGTTLSREKARSMITDFINNNTPAEVQKQIELANSHIADDQSQLSKFQAILDSGKKLSASQQKERESLQSDLSDYQANLATGQNENAIYQKQMTLNQGRTDNLATRQQGLDALYKDSSTLGNSIMDGKYDTNLAPVDNAALATSQNATAVAPKEATAGSAGYTDAKLAALPGYQSATAQTAQPYQAAGISESDLTQARQALGSLDPTNSLQQLLTGKIDNPYLEGINQANINQSMQGYGDMLQNLNQQVMPGINNDAFAAGQYGSSRQGVAQGLALQQAEKNARDLTQSNADQGTKLYGQAYQNAQQNMLSVASELNSQAGQNAQFNVGQANQIGLQNATNEMAGNQYDTSQINDMSKYNAGNTLQNNQFGAQQENALNLANASGAAGASTTNSQLNTNVSLANASNGMNNNQFNAGNTLNNNQFNAGNANTNSQFNANLGLQNNTQQMGQTQNNLNNAVGGLNVLSGANTNYNAGQDALYNNQTDINQYDNQRQLDNITLQQQAAGMTTGGSTSTYGTGGGANPFGQLGGAALTGAGLYKLLG